MLCYHRLMGLDHTTARDGKNKQPTNRLWKGPIREELSSFEKGNMKPLERGHNQCEWSSQQHPRLGKNHHVVLALRIQRTHLDTL